MNEQEALANMVAPGQRRPRVSWGGGGVLQIWVTRSCDKACFGCTQGSHLAGRTPPITVDQFEEACASLKDYWGVVGMFGGNPAIHPEFERLCYIMALYIPFERRGLWCNKLFGKGAIARKTFNPSVSNLNVHLDEEAYAEFRRDWPEAMPFGLNNDSRHSPPYVGMRDLGVSEEERWSLIANCDINQTWSAMIGVFRGGLRGWFCEVAGAQSILHQNDPTYPDTGVPITQGWWKLGMDAFANQVHHHCHDCGVPLRGYGELAQGETGKEQVTAIHKDVYKPKVKGREVVVVEELVQIRPQSLDQMTHYLQNAGK